MLFLSVLVQICSLLGQGGRGRELIKPHLKILKKRLHEPGEGRLRARGVLPPWRVMLEYQHNAFGLKGLPHCSPLHFWWPVIFGKKNFFGGGTFIRGSKLIRNAFLPNGFVEQKIWSVCREEQSSPCRPPASSGSQALAWFPAQAPHY